MALLDYEVELGLVVGTGIRGPMVVAPGLLTRARETAKQYRSEHGTPITPGQLAVRLKVTSEQASQALAVIDLGPHSPTQQIPTVNGKPVKATR